MIPTAFAARCPTLSVRACFFHLARMVGPLVAPAPGSGQALVPGDFIGGDHWVLFCSQHRDISVAERCTYIPVAKLQRSRFGE